MRQTWAKLLHKEMETNENIYLITADLGYGLLDKIFEDYPDRAINVGASEQAAVGIAAGLAMSGKIPFVYSITNFVLYRPYEFIRNFLVVDGLTVHLVGSGRDKDYSHDGPSHHSYDAKDVIEALRASTPGENRLTSFFPLDEADLSDAFKETLKSNQSTFTSLRR